jgi:hypothetical protein
MKAYFQVLMFVKVSVPRLKFWKSNPNQNTVRKQILGASELSRPSDHDPTVDATVVCQGVFL